MERVDKPAERDAFDTLEFTLKPPMERIDRPRERDAFDPLDLRLELPTERVDKPAEREAFDTLEFTRAERTILGFALERLTERAEFGLVSLREEKDSDSCRGEFKASRSIGHEKCVGYQP